MGAYVSHKHTHLTPIKHILILYYNSKQWINEYKQRIVLILCSHIPDNNKAMSQSMVQNKKKLE